MLFRLKTISLLCLEPVIFNSTRNHSMRQNVTESKRKLIISEYELLKHKHPDKVPSKLEKYNLDYLMTLCKNKRRRKLTWIDVSYKLREQTYERLRKLENFEGTDSLIYPLIGSENEKLLRRQQLSMIPFLPNIIFDISFDDHMSSLECKNLAEQLIRIFNLNKYGIENSLNYGNLDLFNLHIANLKSSNNTRNFLESLFDIQLQFYYPNVFFHQDSLSSDIFNGRKLIYLSPHAKEAMTEYDHEAFYIIGGIVDRREIIELTPAKCSHLGIQTLKLPIEALVRQQVQSLCDVYKFLHEFKYNSDSFNSNNIASLVQKYIPNKRDLKS